MARERPEQAHDVAADQRFAAGESQLLRAAADEGGGDPVEFLERQQLLAGGKNCMSSDMQ